MSEKTLWNPDKVNWDLATEDLGLGRICPVQEPNMSSKGYWNPAWKPDKSGKAGLTQ
jgi:hypothetical protein